ISLASESSVGEDTSASTRGALLGGAPMNDDGFQVIPAFWSARVHAPPRTISGAGATAASRRPRARTPIAPVMTQPPSGRARRARLERRAAGGGAFHVRHTLL